MGMKNDVSFLVSGTMNFLEQQSTYNPNLPMRFFLYSAMAYQKYIHDEGEDDAICGSTFLKFPSPGCICFYNGNSEIEDRRVLKLSDAFNGQSDIEVNVTLLNINYGRNKELLDRCKPLKEYSWFTTTVMKKQKDGVELERAIEETLEEMPDDFVIKKFLIANKAEVRSMCLTEFNEEKFKARERAEARAEGKAEGRLDMLVNLVRKGLLSEDNAAAEVKMTVDEFRKQLSQLSAS